MKQLGNNISKNQFSSVLVKFAFCFLLVGLAYRLFTSSFVQFASVAVTDTSSYVFGKELPPILSELPPPVSELQPNVSEMKPIASEPPRISGDHLASRVENQTSQNENCDIFVGDWVPDPTGPPYDNKSCSTIEPPQNCIKNGRPDTGYIYWRWKPRDCELSKFDAIKFLLFMRNKSMAFIGDSIMRNHVQSLLCIISQVADVMEVHHDEHYHNRRWYIPSYEFTLSVVWSPFLTKASILEDDNGVSTGITQLHVDELDTVWTEQYENFDYIYIAGGKWYLKAAIYYENKTIIGCHNCNNKNITEVDFEKAYRKALKSVLSYITSSNHKVYTFFRTTTPDHFENGSWNTGGYCNRTAPFKQGEVDMVPVDQVMHKIEMEEFERALATASGRGLTLELFDTSFLSLLRPDGHPGVYRQFHPFAGKDKNAKIQNDCLHWCLPGPIDSWNDLIWELLRSGRKS